MDIYLIAVVCYHMFSCMLECRSYNFKFLSFCNKSIIIFAYSYFYSFSGATLTRIDLKRDFYSMRN